MCDQCGLECYYEAGVGVVTLKERRVSVAAEKFVVEYKKVSSKPKPKKEKAPRVKKQAGDKSKKSAAGGGENKPKKKRGRPRKIRPGDTDSKNNGAATSQGGQSNKVMGESINFVFKVQEGREQLPATSQEAAVNKEQLPATSHGVEKLADNNDGAPIIPSPILQPSLSDVKLSAIQQSLLQDPFDNGNVSDGMGMKFLEMEPAKSQKEDETSILLTTDLSLESPSEHLKCPPEQIVEQCSSDELSAGSIQQAHFQTQSTIEIEVSRKGATAAPVPDPPKTIKATTSSWEEEPPAVVNKSPAIRTVSVELNEAQQVPTIEQPKLSTEPVGVISNNNNGMPPDTKKQPSQLRRTGQFLPKAMGAVIKKRRGRPRKNKAAAAAPTVDNDTTPKVATRDKSESSEPAGHVMEVDDINNSAMAKTQPQLSNIPKPLEAAQQNPSNKQLSKKPSYNGGRVSGLVKAAARASAPEDSSSDTASLSTASSSRSSSSSSSSDSRSSSETTTEGSIPSLQGLKLTVQEGGNDDASIDNTLDDSANTLRAKYYALLARNSELESDLTKKEEEVGCANATMYSLRGRVSVLTEDLTTVTTERDELAKLKLGNNLHDSLDDTPRLPHHLAPMNMPGDVSNCSTAEIGELQSKIEEVTAERDEAEEQVKELLGVQLQKDDLLVQLQDMNDRLNEVEVKRRLEKLDYEERERVACDDVFWKRKRICKLEGMVEVLAGQRDRANERVRRMLLSGGQFNGTTSKGSTKSNNSQVQRMFTSFKTENDNLATSLKEAKSEAAILKCESLEATKKSTTLESANSELKSKLETVQSQYSKLQQKHRTNDAFAASSFQSEHDECLRELENVNITANILDCNLSSANGRGADSPTADIAAPPQAPKGNPSTSMASLGVPSLAAAQAEQDEESKMDELANTLDSLNDFESFLMDLGLEE